MADGLVHQLRLSPKFRYLRVVMPELMSDSSSWSPSSELPKRLNHRLVIRGMLLWVVIRVAMCTSASRICSLALFMSLIVRMVKLVHF